VQPLLSNLHRLATLRNTDLLFDCFVLCFAEDHPRNQLKFAAVGAVLNDSFQRVRSEIQLFEFLSPGIVLVAQMS
jgi:hypothetical protein